ncbi:MAG TPA: HIT domain-containing protein [Rhizomicrobium sp.]|jgi:diadenosine tetraphosphate (Ap4A) HIT family hydrolase|nr:HIT domain-containing protein [Rhizomicrobium sp.]
MSFALHPRLEADTHLAADWPLCRVLVMSDARYPWLVLVPRRDGVTEITALEASDRAQLMDEIARAGRLVQNFPGVTKLNIGALGNLVPQLHVHVVGRRQGDPAWPGPVWGHSSAVPYDAVVLAQILASVRAG